MSRTVTSNASMKLTKAQWEKIFGKPEDAKVKTTSRYDFEASFTNGGLLGKDSKVY